MAKRLIKAKEYAIKEGDTLESIAKANGLTLSELAKFNFNTDDKAEIAKYYWGRLGAHEVGEDGKFHFRKTDKPGVLFIPEKAEPKYEADKMHTLSIKTPAPEIKTATKCIVKFRPAKTWKGEFGFDWMREKDSGLDGDRDTYENMVLPKAKFKDLKKNYDFFTITKAKDDDTDYDNTAAYVNLYPADKSIAGQPNSATFRMIVDRRGGDPRSLVLMCGKADFKDYLEVTVNGVKHTESGKDAPDAKGEYDFYLKSLKKCDSDITFSLMLKTNDEKGKEVSTKVGQLVFKANGDNNRANAKVVMVAIRTKINDHTEQKFEDAYLEGKIAFMKKYCNQALINVEVTKETMDLGTVGDDFWDDIWGTKPPLKRKLTDVEQFNLDWVRKHYATPTKLAIKNYKDVTGESIHGTLLSRFRTAFPTHKDAYVVFFFKERGFALAPPKDRGLNGAADDIPGSCVVLYQSANDGTCTHELLHAWNLQHTFEKSSTFMFTQNTTDNIMDYSHNAKPPIERIATWAWQWPEAIKQVKKGPLK